MGDERGGIFRKLFVNILISFSIRHMARHGQRRCSIDGVFVYTHAPEKIEGEVDPVLLTKIRSRFTLSQPGVP